MYKCSMIGDGNSIYGFAAAGVEIRAAYTREEALSAIKELVDRGDTAVIFITEALYALVNDDVAALSVRPYPALIPVPGFSGNTGAGKDNITDAVIRAVGSDIG
ncbi:MAG: V-type ATP synthase subunit F [Clostridia bacterium]|nr:V-type ATP synthase subunit F [Clostridia bacterium]